MKRSPAAAFWLSLLPGVGHFYLGQLKKGLTFALLAAGLIQLAGETGEGFFGFLIPILWLFSMLDAHRSAQAINMGMETGDDFSFFAGSGSKWWGGTLIAIGVLFLLYNFDLFDLDWLWQFWPVVLILVGIRLVKPGGAAKPIPAPPEAPPPEDDAQAKPPSGLEEAGDEGESNERADAV